MEVSISPSAQVELVDSRERWPQVRSPSARRPDARSLRGIFFQHRPRVLLESMGLVVALGCSDMGGAASRNEVRVGEILIPQPTDWVDHGPLFEEGDPGDWDHFLWGGFTVSAVKVSGLYHLYYQGSDSFRTEYDATVCNRSIGVAIGNSAMVFEKFKGNPVLRWSPNNECEEGAVAGSVSVSDDGRVLLFFGANTITGRTTVSADLRLAESQDGLSFEDSEVALDHEVSGVWGHGDELFPLLAFGLDSHWFVYYVPNGTLTSRQLGVAWGKSPEQLSQTARVLDREGRPIRVWGPAGYGKVGENKVAIFLKNGPDASLQVRTVSLSSPARMSEPVEVYPFEEVQQATVLLDEERGAWLMFYRGDGFYGLKTAPLKRAPGKEAGED